jgi:hypothetical protein
MQKLLSAGLRGRAVLIPVPISRLEGPRGYGHCLRESRVALLGRASCSLCVYPYRRLSHPGSFLSSGGPQPCASVRGHRVTEASDGTPDEGEIM